MLQKNKKRYLSLTLVNTLATNGEENTPRQRIYSLSFWARGTGMNLMSIMGKRLLLKMQLR